jgi:hypothetical protein
MLSLVPGIKVGIIPNPIADNDRAHTEHNEIKDNSPIHKLLLKVCPGVNEQTRYNRHKQYGASHVNDYFGFFSHGGSPCLTLKC